MSFPQEQNSIFFRRRFLPLLHLCFSKPPGHKGWKVGIAKKLNTTHPVKRKIVSHLKMPPALLCPAWPPPLPDHSTYVWKGWEKFGKVFRKVLKGCGRFINWERFWKTISPSTPQSSSVTSHKAFKSFSSPRAITFLGHLRGTYILCICRHVLGQ